MKRVFLIVLDRMGIGAIADAAEFGDAGYNILKSVPESSDFHMPGMEKSKLFNIDEIGFRERIQASLAVYRRMEEVLRESFADAGAAVLQYLNVPVTIAGIPVL